MGVSERIVERIVELRKKHKLTQAQFAKRIDVTRSALSQYEIGTRNVDNDIIVRIADEFDVSVDYLMGRTDIPNKVLSEGARMIIDNLDLTDEEIVKNIKLEIDGILLTPEQVLTFVNYVRVERAMKKQVPVSNTDNI